MGGVISKIQLKGNMNWFLIIMESFLLRESRNISNRNLTISWLDIILKNKKKIGMELSMDGRYEIKDLTTCLHILFFYLTWPQNCQVDSIGCWYLTGISLGANVTDKVQTPNKVQTVGDKVHTVSEYLQGAPCRWQFAPCRLHFTISQLICTMWCKFGNTRCIRLQCAFF